MMCYPGWKINSYSNCIDDVTQGRVNFNTYLIASNKSESANQNAAYKINALEWIYKMFHQDTEFMTTFFLVYEKFLIYRAVICFR